MEVVLKEVVVWNREGLSDENQEKAVEAVEGEEAVEGKEAVEGEEDQTFYLNLII